MEAQIAVVDNDNRFIRWEGRRAIHEQRLIHRSVYVLVVDSAGRLLLQLRHRDKQTYPLHWDISCAGHVCSDDYLRGPDDDLDEVYRGTAMRELEEELGIQAELRRIGHFGPEKGIHYEQIRLYRAQSDGPIVFQASEVEQTRWVTREEFVDLTSDSEARLTRTLRHFGDWAQHAGHW